MDSAILLITLLMLGGLAIAFEINTQKKEKKSLDASHEVKRCVQALAASPEKFIVRKHAGRNGLPDRRG